MNSKLIVGVILVLVIVAGIFVYTNTKPNYGPNSPSENFLGQELTFETISKGNYGGHDDRKDYVIKDNVGWSNLWVVIHPTRSSKPELPNLDFNDEMVIAVFQGSYSSGGYGIEITKITEKEKSVEVLVTETQPSSGSIVTHLSTKPYHIVKTKRVDKEVVFNR